MYKMEICYESILRFMNLNLLFMCMYKSWKIDWTQLNLSTGYSHTNTIMISDDDVRVIQAHNSFSSSSLINDLIFPSPINLL